MNTASTCPNSSPLFRTRRTFPYLPDVARMEWLAHRAYYAADAELLDLTKAAVSTRKL